MKNKIFIFGIFISLSFSTAKALDLDLNLEKFEDVQFGAFIGRSSFDDVQIKLNYRGASKPYIIYSPEPSYAIIAHAALPIYDFYSVELGFHYNTSSNASGFIGNFRGAKAISHFNLLTRALMFNNIFEKDFSGFIPYLGFGLGLSFVTAEKSEIDGTYSDSNLFSDATPIQLARQMLIGYKVLIDSQLFVNIRMLLFNYGPLLVKDNVSSGEDKSKDDVAGTSILFGAHYLF